jgi:hypothetical protein
MFGSLVSHNEDLARLVDKGYALGFDSEYLVVRDIPYLDNELKVQQGAIVSKMVVVDEYRRKLHDHQIFFCGSQPYQVDGTLIRNLGGGPATLSLEGKDLIVERSFSNKPPGDYKDFFEKIENYVNMISGPAIHLYNANPLTFRTNQTITGSVFKIHDTLTSLAEIGDLNQNFKDDVVAIIGLGGTGSYLMDFLAKTPVEEIRGFDKDLFYAHNAFRSPGRLGREELGKPKAEIYQKRYDEFRLNVKVKAQYIHAGSASELDGVTFAFVCVDKGSSRKEIFDLLINMKIPFIDVGIGLDRKRGPISGGLRVTYYDIDNAEQLSKKGLAPLTDDKNEIYNKNIQIAELNALNACFAIIKFKQLRGFYADDTQFFHMLFGINDLKNAGE